VTSAAEKGLAELAIAAARVSIGEQPTEDLPRLATDALLREVDSPSLRLLAGTPPRDVREAAELFRAALDGLGVPLPSEQDALWALVRHVAERIVAGRVDPYAGASWIWRHAYHRVDKEADLRVFVGLASELEDHPADRDRINAAIVETSRALLATREPRIWVKFRAQPRVSPLSDPRTGQAIGLQSIPIPAELVQELEEWANVYDDTYPDDGRAAGFASRAEAVAFVERGRHLSDRMQAILGPQGQPRVRELERPRRHQGSRDPRLR
jgi:hypothetical protein